MLYFFYYGAKIMERRDKVNYYLDLAEIVSQRSTCLRKRYGAVIVKMMKLFLQAM